MENEIRNSRGRKAKKKSDVFISWSGTNSKEIAGAIKWFLEKIFAKEKIKCFTSDQDIASGADWWNKIHSELKACKISIICITKENIKAPWIYYEAGAMVAQGVQKIIPLFINCSLDALKGTPLHTKQAVDFYDFQKIKKWCVTLEKKWDIRKERKKIRIF